MTSLINCLRFRRYPRPPLFGAALLALSIPLQTVAAQHAHTGDSDSTATMPGMSAIPGMSHPSPAADTTPAMRTMSMSSTPLGIPMQRRGSGTSWLPDASPMYGSHSMLGGWDVMLHGVAFLQYDDQGSKRGDKQLGSINWGMAMASHPLVGGTLSVSGMLSGDPFTVGARGYPLLLQSGESYHGVALHDRQHPHDLFMEIAAQYDHTLTDKLAGFVYAAPVGEPALGPVAFPHRPSAMNDPFAPIGHHWQDATHIAFGVVTAGIYTRTVRLEGSVFNGREPDENRTNFDYKGRSLDSYAGRLTVNPSERWSLSASYGYLKSPELLHPDESQHRMTASALFAQPLGMHGDWSSAIAYGGNKVPGAPLSNSVLAETNVDLDGRNTLFGRGEIVEKTGDDLAVTVLVPPPDAEPSGAPSGAASGAPAARFTVGELTLGYVREIANVFGGSLGLGAAGTVNALPSSLEPVYGTRTPLGASIFLRVRPGRMRMGVGGLKSAPSAPMPGMSSMP